MELEWESDFETGNKYVDGQHRYFVDLINRIRISFRETNDITYKEKRNRSRTQMPSLKIGRT